MAVSITRHVARLYNHPKYGCFIRLKDTTPTTTPKDGYFLLEKGNEAFTSLYALAMLAAANNLRMTIRAQATITPTAWAKVGYLVIDF